MMESFADRGLPELVARGQQGDHGAFAELVRRCQDMAVRYAFGLVGDHALAEDAAQEAFVEAYRCLGDLRTPEAFIPWLRTIVFKHCDRLRRQRTLTIVPLADLVTPVDDDLAPDELVLRAERALAVRQAIASLPDAQRDVTAAFYFGGLTQPEVAELLGVPTTTVNNRLHAARRTLERNLYAMTDIPDRRPDRARPNDGLADRVMTMLAPHADDADGLYAAIEHSSPAGTDWRQGRLAHSRFDWSVSRIAAEDERLQAMVGVFDLTMRIGTAQVRTAGFNLDHVAEGAPPDALAKATAAAANAAGDAGYGIAVAVGHGPALRDAGFVRGWPHMMWFVPVAVLTGAKGPSAVREVDPVATGDIAALIGAEHDGLTGTCVRPTYLHNKEPGGFQGLAWDADGAQPAAQTADAQTADAQAVGNAAGYVSYAVVDEWRNRALLGGAHHGFDRLLWHDESAGDPDQRLAVLEELAREHGCREIAFDRLHPRSRLARRIRELPHRIEQEYRWYSVKVLSLDTLMRALAPELERRLASADSSPLTSAAWSLRLSLDDEAVALSCGARGAACIEVGPSTGNEADAVEGDQRVARLLIGAGDPDEVIDDAELSVTGEGRRLTRALFPALHPQMDNQSL